MKNILLIFLLLIISSLSPSKGFSQNKKELIGYWMGSYQITYASVRQMEYVFADSADTIQGKLALDKDYNSFFNDTIPNQVLLEITDKNISISRLNYIDYAAGEWKEIETNTFPYHLINNQIILKKDTISDTVFLKFNSINQFVISPVNIKNPPEFFFTKVRPSKNIKELTIKPGLYKLIDGSYIDTLDFLNDSVILPMGNSHFSGEGKYWQRQKHKEFSFFMPHWYQWTLFRIDSNQNDTLFLTNYFPKTRQFKMIKTNYHSDITNIYGAWNEVEKELPDSIPPPPLSEGLKQSDLIETLTISKDSITMKHWGRIIKKSFLFNTTSEYLFFPDKLWRSEAFWKIIKLTKDKLIIERKPYYSSDGSNQIEYEKVQKIDR